MLYSQRVIFKDNTALKDMSVELNDLTANNYTIPFVAAEDSIYIGSDLPFNHRYIYISTANDQASVVSVAIWDGTQWVSAVDVQDETSSGGVSLAQSGIISWSTDKDSFWDYEDTSENITAISSLKIYNLYWVRLTFSADLKATTALKYVGHKFAKDGDLAPLGYSDLNTSDVKTAFETGKTTWDDQHIAAGEQVVRYLQQKHLTRSANQIFDWKVFNEPAIHKVAEIIYSSFGSDYEERRKLAEAKFYKSMNTGGVLRLDRNADGHADIEERVRSVGLYRS